jgi:hypothetical protein
VDAAPEQPCFQLSVLDCFREGRAFVHGGANNSVYYSAYAQRRSFREFDFSREFTVEYLQRECKAWFNLASPWRMVLGGADIAPSSTASATAQVIKGDDSGPVIRREEKTAAAAGLVRSVQALQVVFGTRVQTDLQVRGLQGVTWGETPADDNSEGGGADVMGCGPGDDCETCMETFNFFDAIREDVACVPDNVPQKVSEHVAANFHKCISAKERKKSKVFSAV